MTRDWQLYGKEAPLIAFHDIVGTGEIEKVGGRSVEVPILWQRLRANLKTHEFVGDGSKMGIGVVEI